MNVHFLFGELPKPYFIRRRHLSVPQPYQGQVYFVFDNGKIPVHINIAFRRRRGHLRVLGLPSSSAFNPENDGGDKNNREQEPSPRKISSSHHIKTSKKIFQTEVGEPLVRQQLKLLNNSIYITFQVHAWVILPFNSADHYPLYKVLLYKGINTEYRRTGNEN
jgi:hypothetical protein